MADSAIRSRLEVVGQTIQPLLAIICLQRFDQLVQVAGDDRSRLRLQLMRWSVHRFCGKL